MIIIILCFTTTFSMILLYSKEDAVIGQCAALVPGTISLSLSADSLQLLSIALCHDISPPFNFIFYKLFTYHLLQDVIFSNSSVLETVSCQTAFKLFRSRSKYD